jgi:membrane associated rhomboid family serine protease
MHRKKKKKTVSLLSIGCFRVIVFTFCRLRVLGALEKDLVVGENEVWRFFTCMFLHAGVIHLLANMFSLLFIGVRLENEFGFCKHISIYIEFFFFNKLKLFSIFV